MTNLDALAGLTPFTSNSNLLSLVLINNNISESDTYSKSNFPKIELCSAYVIKRIVNDPDFSEGSLSIKYDRERMIKTANEIFSKNGLFSEKIINNRISII